MSTLPYHRLRRARAHVLLTLCLIVAATACSPTAREAPLCLPTAVIGLIEPVADAMHEVDIERAIGLWTVTEANACDDRLRVRALIERSRLYASRFDHDRAVADMDAAVALTPDDPLVYVERGQRVMLLYEWDRVLADYNRALQLDPLYADAHYYRAILYASVPEAADARRAALADFERYLELAPDGSHAARARQYADQLAAQIAALDTP